MLAWGVLVARPAHAYLDPSTGGMLISALVGLLASLGLVLKTSWYRVRGLFRRGDQRSMDRILRPEDSVERERHADP